MVEEQLAEVRSRRGCRRRCGTRAPGAGSRPARRSRGSAAGSRDDRADRLVDERDPDVLEAVHRPKYGLGVPPAPMGNARRSYRKPVDRLERLRQDPARAAILLDVDGTLAPIVERPEDAGSARGDAGGAARLVPRYGLVAAVTGRAGVDRRTWSASMASTSSATTGSSSIPTRTTGAGGCASSPAQSTGRSRTRACRCRSTTGRRRTRPRARRAGASAERARRQGLKARFGRMVLELVPPIDANKGTAVRELLAARRSDAGALRGRRHDRPRRVRRAG